MAIAKITLNGVTQMDVTGKTVTPESMLPGATALKNDGSDIEGSMEYDVKTGTPIINTTYFSAAASIHVRKQWNIVVVQFEASPLVNIGAYYTFLTLPTGFRPQETTYFPAVYNNALLHLRIETGGAVQPITAISGNARLAFCVSFIVA